MKKKEVFKIYELTNPQKNILQMDQVNNKCSSVSHILSVMKLNSVLDTKILKKTIETIIERNDSFHIHFKRNKDGSYSQFFADPEKPIINIHKINNENISPIKDFYKNFELSLVQLFAFGLVFTPTHTYVFYKSHHIIADGWGMTQVAEQIKEIYSKLLSGETLDNYTKPSYTSLIKREQDYLTSSKYKTDYAFWNKYVSNLGTTRLFHNDDMFQKDAIRSEHLIPSSNLRYGKNQKREDVKSHHYIISFDPRDAVDNGLTVDRAQALGEEFCRKQFPGHQAIVCTHPDGHNHSGNIHVHIVINSLRIEEVPFLPYMDRPADTRAGCKHRCTDAAMEYFKAEVMELCHRENLYQIDLLHGSKNRITEREYWAQRKGQAKLDKEAAALPAEEQPAKPTKFETDKEKLRQAIRTALSSAASYGEFAAVLLQQGVTVKESRGRLSYLTPDRTKPITARKLGDDFDRAAVLALLEQNAHRAAEQTATVPEYPRNIRERLQGKKAVQTTPEKDGIQRMVDRAAKRAEGKGAGYDRWAAVHNLKQMAATVAAYGQYGYSPEELDAALVSANADLQDSTAKLKALDAAIREKKELQTQVLAYAKTKPARDGLKAQKTEKARSAYRERHESDFIIADAATRYFRAHGVSKLPSHKALQAEIEQLTAEKNAHYNEYREKKARVKELHTVKSNLSQILQGEKDREKKHEHER